MWPFTGYFQAKKVGKNALFSCVRLLSDNTACRLCQLARKLRLLCVNVGSIISVFWQGLLRSAKPPNSHQDIGLNNTMNDIASSMGIRKRVLVTGGAGFLGSHLCERLLSEGNEVICMDNYFTGSKQNIQHLMDNTSFELMRHDVTFPVYLEIDEIYNLACPASPIHYQHDPVQTTKTSVHGAINMLGLAKRTGAKIFQASTSEVYGDPKVHPQHESYWGHVNPIGFRSCYDEGKRCAETLFFDYRRQHDLRIKVGRIFNTYGPRMHPNDGRVVSNFIVQALTGQPITIYGEGDQTRSFCYCLDLIEAFVRLMNTDDSFTGPVNIGNPSEFTIKQLAEKVIEMTNSSSKLVYKELPSDDPTQRRPDITLAKETMGWEPKVALEDGLKSTIEYFDSLLSDESATVSQMAVRAS